MLEDTGKKDESETTGCAISPLLTSYSTESIRTNFASASKQFNGLNKICTGLKLLIPDPSKLNVQLNYLGDNASELFTRDICEFRIFSGFIDQLLDIFGSASTTLDARTSITKIIVKCLEVQVFNTISSQQLLDLYYKIKSKQHLVIPDMLFDKLIIISCKHYSDLEKLYKVENSYIYRYITDNKISIIKNITLSDTEALDTRRQFGIQVDDTSSDLAKAIAKAIDPQREHGLIRRASMIQIPHTE